MLHDIVLEVVGVIRKDVGLGSNSPGEEVLRSSLSFPRAAAEVKTQRLSIRSIVVPFIFAAKISGRLRTTKFRILLTLESTFS
jgi:hypothetical protein